jgi:mevalonate kinase
MIDENQKLLCELGVGHEAIDKICAITASFGLHSKLTGAGGGGCVLTLLSDGIHPFAFTL